MSDVCYQRGHEPRSKVVCVTLYSYLTSTFHDTPQVYVTRVTYTLYVTECMLLFLDHSSHLTLTWKTFK